MRKTACQIIVLKLVKSVYMFKMTTPIYAMSKLSNAHSSLNTRQILIKLVPKYIFCKFHKINPVYEKNCLSNNSFKIGEICLYVQNDHPDLCHVEIVKCPQLP